jgi:hypothetical protein
MTRSNSTHQRRLCLSCTNGIDEMPRFQTSHPYRSGRFEVERGSGVVKCSASSFKKYASPRLSSPLSQSFLESTADPTTPFQANHSECVTWQIKRPLIADPHLRSQQYCRGQKSGLRFSRSRWLSYPTCFLSGCSFDLCRFKVYRFKRSVPPFNSLLSSRTLA